MGSVEKRLAALVQVAPDEATVPVRWLRELLAEQGSASGGEAAGSRRSAGEPLVDLTVQQVAALFSRGDSTVRTWLSEGRFPSAYRLQGREWRIPAGDVEQMQRAERERHRRGREQPATQSAPTDLGEWRKHVRRSG